MQLNSYIYILFFLPISVVLYYMTNRFSAKIGKVTLVVLSLLFYLYAGLNYTVILIISVILNLLFAKLIERGERFKKVYVIFPIAVNVLLLLYFKYFNFALINICSIIGKDYVVRDIILPLGISFYTFQQIAYIVEVSKGAIQVNILDYLAYILYYPKILMGPLMDPTEFLVQINDPNNRKVDWNHIVSGLKLVSFGLFKKLVLADTFAKAVAVVYDNMSESTSMDVILAVLFYTLEIYFDFSGYCDMATGSSLALNIKLPINFDSPYKALSVRDFWKRWHISLTSFFTKYIYIPLGGSRRGKVVTYLNVMLVFLISGIWHGANWTFILWGILHGLFSVLERIFDKAIEKVFLPVRWICTFGIVSLLWALFRADSIGQWKSILYSILTLKDTSISSDLIRAFNNPELPFIERILRLGSLVGFIRGYRMLVFILFGLMICLIPQNNYRNMEDNRLIWAPMAAIAFVWGLICLGSESVFVYFGF